MEKMTLSCLAMIFPLTCLWDWAKNTGLRSVLVQLNTTVGASYQEAGKGGNSKQQQLQPQRAGVFRRRDAGPYDRGDGKEHFYRSRFKKRSAERFERFFQPIFP